MSCFVRSIAIASLSILFCTALAAADEKHALNLWYNQPARQWNDAPPIGNGRMGAMVFGRTADERIQFNEDTLWKGHPHDYVRTGAGEQLPERCQSISL